MDSSSLGLLFIGGATAVAAIASAIAACQANRLIRNAHRAEIKPVLVFSRRTTNHWQSENIGNGPAVNVRVREMNAQGIWQVPVQLYAMSATSHLELDFLQSMNTLETVYEDAENQAYKVIAKNNRSNVESLLEYPANSTHWQSPISEYDAKNGEYKKRFNSR